MLSVSGHIVHFLTIWYCKFSGGNFFIWQGLDAIIHYRKRTKVYWNLHVYCRINNSWCCAIFNQPPSAIDWCCPCAPTGPEFTYRTKRKSIDTRYAPTKQTAKSNPRIITAPFSFYFCPLPQYQAIQPFSLFPFLSPLRSHKEANKSTAGRRWGFLLKNFYCAPLHAAKHTSSSFGLLSKNLFALPPPSPSPSLPFGRYCFTILYYTAWYRRISPVWI